MSASYIPRSSSVGRLQMRSRNTLCKDRDVQNISELALIAVFALMIAARAFAQGGLVYGSQGHDSLRPPLGTEKSVPLFMCCSASLRSPVCRKSGGSGLTEIRPAPRGQDWPGSRCHCRARRNPQTAHSQGARQAGWLGSIHNTSSTLSAGSMSRLTTTAS